MNIKTSKDFVTFISETMENVKNGDISPAAGNAIANLTGKMLQSVKLDIEVHRYVSGDNRDIKALQTELIGKDKQLSK